MFYTRAVDAPGQHVIQHALSLASKVAGQELQYDPPPFPVDPAAEAWAESLMSRVERKATGYHQSGRRLGSEVLAGGVFWRGGARPRPSGAWRSRSITARAKKRLAEAVSKFSGATALPVRCSVGELIALTRRARLFIGGDTGPMHLAAALRVPVVALFGPTRPERNGPFGTPSVVLRSPESVDNTTHTDRPDEGLDFD